MWSWKLKLVGESDGTIEMDDHKHDLFPDGFNGLFLDGGAAVAVGSHFGGPERIRLGQVFSVGWDGVTQTGGFSAGAQIVAGYSSVQSVSYVFGCCPN